MVALQDEGIKDTVTQVFQVTLWRRAAQESCPTRNDHFGLGVNEK